jgi:hypothetical protein
MQAAKLEKKLLRALSSEAIRIEPRELKGRSIADVLATKLSSQVAKKKLRK